MSKLSETTERKFIESMAVSEWEILTDTGWQDIQSLHVTVPYEKYHICTVGGKQLECADTHILFDEDYKEIYVKDLNPQNSSIITINGPEKIQSVHNTGLLENMFDLTIDSPNHRFYTNDILSHNSTFLEAMSFSLFGIPYRNINKPNLVNSINNKDCCVEIEFSIGKKHYKVIRGIKPTIFEIYIDGKMLEQSASTKDQQKYFEQTILKMNYRSFTQLVILGASEYTPFMKLAAADRRAIIEELLDIGVFSSMNEVLKTKQSLAREDIKNIDRKIATQNEKIQLQQEHITNMLRRDKDVIDQYKASIADEENKKQVLLSEIADIDCSVQNKLALIQDQTKIREYYEKYTSTKEAIEKQISKTRKTIEFYTNNLSCPTCTQPIDDAFKNKTTAEKTAKVQELLNGLTECESRISTYYIRLQEIGKVQAEIDKLQREIRDRHGTITGIDHYISTMQENLRKMTMVSSSIEEEQRRLEEFQNEAKELVKAREELIEISGTYDLAGEMLKDSGIKTQIIRQYLPIINKSVNKYLNAMDAYFNFTLDETFKEIIKSRYRDEFQFESFSAGQQFRINMALLLTWREIAKRKNSTNCNLLILDEVFDGSLDLDGVNEFMKLLRALSKKINIFAITHKADTIGDKFDRQLKVELKNNFSSIKE